jgi:hypothetical protein
MRRVLFTCAISLFLAEMAGAAPLTIENGALKVDYHESERSFSIIEKATGNTVVSNLRIESLEDAAETPSPMRSPASASRRWNIKCRNAP